MWLAGSRAQAQKLWRMGLVALWHVGSSQTRDRTRVPCIGRRILKHCTTREVLHVLLNRSNYQHSTETTCVNIADDFHVKSNGQHQILILLDPSVHLMQQLTPSFLRCFLTWFLRLYTLLVFLLPHCPLCLCLLSLILLFFTTSTCWSVLRCSS